MQSSLAISNVRAYSILGLLIILFDGYTISGIDSQAMFFSYPTSLTFTSLHIFVKRDIVIPISAGQSLPGSYNGVLRKEVLYLGFCIYGFEHLPYKQGVTGSNPVVPTTVYQEVRSIF